MNPSLLPTELSSQILFNYNQYEKILLENKQTMRIMENLFSKYAKLHIFFRSFFIVVILFLVFFSINLYVSILKSKPRSAYSVLEEKQTKLMLQDTRVHNWSEIEKKK